jgi:hypothetical protein
MNETDECTGSTVYVSATAAAEPKTAKTAARPICRNIDNMIDPFIWWGL